MPTKHSEIPDSVTLREAAFRLAVSHRTMQRIVAAGDIDIIRPGSERGRIRITQQAIDDYLQRRMQAGIREREQRRKHG